jgi:predicted phage baseplate assembly protein
MVLPAPDLDDRRFQDLVDDAKRLVQRSCPEWSDHNVSDPGVTLIETFAYMVDQLIYRLNRVPERNYIRFLDLIGVRLFPPSAATTDVTFWLSVPQSSPVTVRRGAKVTTSRTGTIGPAVVFTTTDQLDMVPVEVAHVCSEKAGGGWRDHTDSVKLAPFPCFSARPVPGEALHVGLSVAAPRCVVKVVIRCATAEGTGVDPDWPPLVWEAYDGESWSECEVDEDTTKGLNQDGKVIVHLPATHVAALDHELQGGWLRARVTTPEEGRPPYERSPLIAEVQAATIGGTIGAVQAELIEDEILGVSEGVPGQRFAVARPPVLPSVEPPALEVSGEEGWQQWTAVADFSGSRPEDHHFVLDPVGGEVVLGPAVRGVDGRLRSYGAVPPKGSVLRLRRYQTGGGRQGNVAKGAIRVCRTTVPYVSQVENRLPASGGVDGEDVEEAKIRGPILLRTLGRAVTAEDYEQLAREAAPGAARVRAVPAATPEDAGGVRVLLVPAVADNELGRLSFEQLIPPREMLSAVASYLEARRTIGARVMVQRAAYQGVTVVALLRGRPWADLDRLQKTATEALYDYLHPLTGGTDGTGWPFGRAVHVGEIYALLHGIPATEMVEDLRLFPANPLTGERGSAAQQVDVAPNALVFSYEHQVLVEGA